VHNGGSVRVLRERVRYSASRYRSGISSSSLQSSTSWTGLLEADGRLAKVLVGQPPATRETHIMPELGARNAACAGISRAELRCINQPVA
jgi:hypothetical protein